MIQLIPGESIQDTLVLNPRMPSLLDDIAQFGVQLRWDCPPAFLKVCVSKGFPSSPDYSERAIQVSRMCIPLDAPRVP